MKCKLLFLIVCFFVSFSLYAQQTTVWDISNNPVANMVADPCGAPTSGFAGRCVMAGGAYLAGVPGYLWYATHGCPNGNGGQWHVIPRMHIEIYANNLSGTPSACGFEIFYKFKAGYTYVVTIEAAFSDYNGTGRLPTLQAVLSGLSIIRDPSFYKLCTRLQVRPVDLWPMPNTSGSAPGDTFTKDVKSLTFKPKQDYPVIQFSSIPAAGTNGGAISLFKLTIEEKI
ncbi:hypothetical protein [Chitinophaga nivalis]|uniref:Uncharacterized protein n=1 Tax=Chitinophaga nivalis TaxID=2991709 RepID=A0ABT3IIA5_9BACT|nr:hypothetical protein [Chitinophaga nivalis]MCW3466617.1 hypothetical protein [Chitinophaga nivalis]MCW3483692.1 hypothetical protein [Chitinophaga nivalis]